jgi:hypothetical protein
MMHLRQIVILSIVNTMQHFKKYFASSQDREAKGRSLGSIYETQDFEECDCSFCGIYTTRKECVDLSNISVNSKFNQIGSSLLENIITANPDGLTILMSRNRTKEDIKTLSNAPEMNFT